MADEKDEKKLKELVLLILQSQKPFEHAEAPEAEAANASLDAVANEIAELFGDTIGTDVKKAKEVVELYKEYVAANSPKGKVLQELEKGAVNLSSAFKDQLVVPKIKCGLCSKMVAKTAANRVYLKGKARYFCKNHR